MRVRLLFALCLSLLMVAGCGSEGDSGDGRRQARQEAAREARLAEKRQLAREARRAEARARRQAARQRARRAAARQRAREEARQQRTLEREEAEAAEEESECDPSYSGACLDPYASDYDCEGGSGDGPLYTGPVAVVGEDHYGLDSDGDGYACEY